MSVKAINIGGLIVVVLCAGGFYGWQRMKVAEAEAAYFRNDSPVCLNCGKEY